jgi:hypothetical protein
MVTDHRQQFVVLDVAETAAPVVLVQKAEVRDELADPHLRDQVR